MAAAAPKVTQRAWDDQARELMQPSVDASPWATVEGFANVLAGAHLFEVEQGASRVLLALRGVQMEHGRLLDVVGMRSLGARVQTAQLLDTIEQLARERYERVDLLSMCTRHPHLVRACVRHGWTEAASLATKPLRLQ